MHAEDGTLRRVDDGRAHERAEGAAVADGEAASGHVLERDGVGLGLLRELAHGEFDLRVGHALGVAQHGHDQAARAGHSDADVDIIAVDDLRDGESAMARQGYEAGLTPLTRREGGGGGGGAAAAA